MVVKVKDFGLENQQKILSRYAKYYKRESLVWAIPQHEMKNIISECWDLSHILNKHKHLDMQEVLDTIKFDTLVKVKDNYNKLSQADFYKYIVEELRKLEHLSPLNK